MKQLTIFTPTYNRANTLPRLYNSLLKQDSSLFYWLIVDDGSKDNTKSLIDKWRKEGIIEIEYHYQENEGKMQAHNLGVRLCKTELFLCCDSDDWITSDSITSIIRFWNDYKKSLASKKLEKKVRSEISGIVAPKKIVKKELSIIPCHSLTSKLSTIYEDGYIGETALIFITSIIRQYPFPKITGEKFITEDYIYCQLDEKYEMLVYPHYFMECEYQLDGYSQNIHRIEKDNPKGFALYFNEKSKHVHGLREKLTKLRYYIAFSRKSKYSFTKIVHESSYPLLTILSALLSVIWNITKQFRR